MLLKIHIPLCFLLNGLTIIVVCYSPNSACCYTSSLMVLSDLLNLANVLDRKWYLITVLLGIYLIVTEFQHLFKCLLTMLVSSFLNCLFKVIANFFIRLLVFPDFYVLYIFWILYHYK